MSEENTNETADQQADNENTGENATDTATENAEETKAFTQEDVNKIATKEARKAQEKLFKELGIEDFDNAKEGFQKFQKWQQDQMTEQEKQSKQLETLHNDNENKESEIETLNAQISAMKSGVKAESVEDVVTLAKNIVSDDVDMDTAIKQVVEKYPHFAQSEQKEEPKPSFTTGQHQSGNRNNDPFAAKIAKYN